MDNPGDRVLNEQLAYYRARAPEYDEWWLRQERYDRGAELNAQWFADVALLEQALQEFGPRGSILEFAPGTGLWSQRLRPNATQLTLVDGSREMLARAAARLGDKSVRCIQADIFSWQPRERYDTIFFSFWLSHVPPERLGMMFKTPCGPRLREMEPGRRRAAKVGLSARQPSSATPAPAPYLANPSGRRLFGRIAALRGLPRQQVWAAPRALRCIPKSRGAVAGSFEHHPWISGASCA